MIPDSFWERIKTVQGIHRRLYESGRGWLVGWMILLLEHTGRKSGKRYATPVQYERIDGAYFIGAARGTQADWFRNVLANPGVHVRVGRREFDCRAEPITDPDRVADYLESRLKNHPIMVGLMMKFAHGLPLRPTHEQLARLAKDLAVVRLTPPEVSHGTD
jgi:deazaflavin-dependent oxidoreductase (nitroreductase family)